MIRLNSLCVLWPPRRGIKRRERESLIFFTWAYCGITVCVSVEVRDPLTSFDHPFCLPNETANRREPLTMWVLLFRLSLFFFKHITSWSISSTGFNSILCCLLHSRCASRNPFSYSHFALERKTRPSSHDTFSQSVRDDVTIRPKNRIPSSFNSVVSVRRLRLISFAIINCNRPPWCVESQFFLFSSERDRRPFNSLTTQCTVVRWRAALEGSHVWTLLFFPFLSQTVYSCRAANQPRKRA